MQVAQRLYEGVDIGGETQGLITYMRTDGVQIAGEAIAACRVIAREFGEAYVPGSPRSTRPRPRTPRRPTRPSARPLSRLPAQVARYLDTDQARLYELIWKRTVASQMESADHRAHHRRHRHHRP
jgi:DNA topoisomerase I